MPRAYATAIQHVRHEFELEVRSEEVLTDIPSLGEENAEEEDEQGNARTDPAVQDERRRLIQQGLILLQICISYGFAIARGHQGQRTLWRFEVWAVTAAKGVCSGSGASMVASSQGERRQERRKSKLPRWRRKKRCWIIKRM